MKIATYLLGAMLAAALGAAALFYFQTFQPMQAEYAKMKPAMPELDKAKAELRKYKAKETQETGWIAPVVNDMSKQLEAEINAGKAEVTATGGGIVVNISEEILYTPRSVTFHKDSKPLLQKLATILSNKDLNGKEIVVANLTEAAPAQGKGRKKIPPKDARTLAADRSLALTKWLEQNKVDQQGLIAAGYGAKLPDTGFKIKDHKTMIVISNPPTPAAAPVAAQPKPVPASAQAPAPQAGEKPVAPPAAGAPQPQPKPQPIPLKPTAPKGQ